MRKIICEVPGRVPGTIQVLDTGAVEVQRCHSQAGIVTYCVTGQVTQDWEEGEMIQLRLRTVLICNKHLVSATYSLFLLPLPLLY